MKKKYNIAIAGTFDVENYGDLMFPVVFEKAMKKRELDFNLFMFSPSPAAKKALDESKMVYSYLDFDKLNEKYKFDALVVGGGAIIHFNDIKVRLPNDETYSKYRNIDSWYTLIYKAVKSNIKILFNVPQAPFEFDGAVSSLARGAFLSSEYISVRDTFSEGYIRKVFQKGEKALINVYPDSVCSISNYYDKEKLAKIARKIVGFSDKYVAIHFSVSMPEEAEPSLVEAINTLHKNGYKVVLLPLGYTHGDDVAMSKFAKKYKIDCFMFDHKLSIDDMTAVLAGCELYIGTSFHGSIVSLSFGNKAISYNYHTPTLKNVDNYKRLGISKYLANNYTELNPVLELVLNDEKYKTKIAQIKEQVEEHFDNLYRHIVDLKESVQGDQMIEGIRAYIEYTRDKSDEYEKEKKKLTDECNEYKNKYEGLKKVYEDTINSASYKIMEPVRTIKKIIRKEK